MTTEGRVEGESTNTTVRGVGGGKWGGGGGATEANRCEDEEADTGVERGVSRDTKESELDMVLWVYKPGKALSGCLPGMI